MEIYNRPKEMKQKNRIHFMLDKTHEQNYHYGNDSVC